MRVRQIVKTEPDWLATVEMDDGTVKSLTFMVEPTVDEVLAQAAVVAAFPEIEFEVEAEDGTII